MLWAAACLCFFALIRSGEVTVPSDTVYIEGAHLSFKDVTIDYMETPRMLKVKIKASKTDPVRMGVDVYVGRTCVIPMSAMLSYMVVRGASPGSLFIFQDGRPLTRARFVIRVHTTLAAAGIDPTPYSGHIFRSGAATTASNQGIRDAT